MDIRDILLGGGGVTVVLLSLIQIAPVQLNPWSWIAKRIGRAINAEVPRFWIRCRPPSESWMSISSEMMPGGPIRCGQTSWHSTGN